jgi:hypothetical protein
MPSIELDGEEERLELERLRSMSREELERVPHQVKKWKCHCEGCGNGSRVWDFGILPWFYWPGKHRGWTNLNNTFLLCWKHYRLSKRLWGHYDPEHIWRRLKVDPRAIAVLQDIQQPKVKGRMSPESVKEIADTFTKSGT